MTVDHTFDDDLLPPGYSEDHLAVNFTDAYGDDLRYTEAMRRWHQWDGSRWREDDTLDVFSKARHICRRAANDAEKALEEKDVRRLASAQTVAAVERLARADRQHEAVVSQWDAHLMQLNTPAGIVNLETGRLMPHDCELYHTKITAAGPGDPARCVLWRASLKRITGGDDELAAFLARMVGYCLTGSVKDHAMFFLYGTGANGKSVFINTLFSALGDYARAAPVDMLVTNKNNDRHPTELAMCRGARVVSCVETEEGRPWAESKVKMLTGDDPITARFMRQDFFTYMPQFKLVVSGNHKPTLRSVDEAIRRRFNLVPFNVTIPEDERDKNLREKLKAEWPHILAWAIEGCREWQWQGLNPPPAVIEATRDYLAAEDLLSQWLEECCVDSSPTAFTASSALFRNWYAWMREMEEYPGTHKSFSQALKNHGYQDDKYRGERGFRGIVLRQRSIAPSKCGTK